MANIQTYQKPDSAWSIQFPADLLHPEDLGDGTVVFISDDRSTFVAVDSFFYPGAAFGNTGEELRNRARDTLARIYGRPVQEMGIIERPGERWQTGIRFQTDRGSQGEAMYEQLGWAQGNYRVNGVLIGVKAANAAEMLPILRAARASFAPAADPAQALLGFFSLLHDDHYDAAVQLYGGPYDLLRTWNPGVPRDQYATLLQRGCTQNGLMCLNVRQILHEQPISSTVTRFVVEFALDNGDLFHAGAQTEFTYTVVLQNGRYKVQGLPVYMP